MRRVNPSLSLAGAWILAALAGCNGAIPGERMRQLDKQVRELTDKVDELTNGVATKDALIDAQRKQITTLQRLGDKRLEKLCLVTAIKLDRLTGGANYDDKPGHDGVTVYIQPVDQDGHVIKAAGDIRIELFDLANPDGQHRIDEYRLDVDHARQFWHGRLMTHHYTVKCPWRTGPPAHDEITVRVGFTDYLTGKTFLAQTVVQVKLK